MAEMLLNGKEIGQDLSGVKLIGQAVPHRNTGVVCQILHDLLAVATVLDAVKHPAQHPGGVGDGLLFADLAAGGVQIGHFHAQIVGGHLKATAGAGGGLFKDSEQYFCPAAGHDGYRLLFGLQVSGQLQQLPDLGGGVVQ